LGRNPKKGGRPPKDRKDKNKIVCFGAGILSRKNSLIYEILNVFNILITGKRVIK
jgi:hypothetical protein